MPIKALAVQTWEFCVSWGSWGVNAVKGLASHVINLQLPTLRAPPLGRCEPSPTGETRPACEYHRRYPGGCLVAILNQAGQQPSAVLI